MLDSREGWGLGSRESNSLACLTDAARTMAFPFHSMPAPSSLRRAGIATRSPIMAMAVSTADHWVEFRGAPRRACPCALGDVRTTSALRVSVR